MTGVTLVLRSGNLKKVDALVGLVTLVACSPCSTNNISITIIFQSYCFVIASTELCELLSFMLTHLNIFFFIFSDICTNIYTNIFLIFAVYVT